MNSLNEDIKIVENVLKTKEYGLCEITDTFYQAIENLLKGYKELEEKNTECTFLEDGTEEGLWKCSNCKDEWIFYDGTPEDNRLKYCPFCGAKVIKYKSDIVREIEAAEKMVES